MSKKNNPVLDTIITLVKALQDGKKDKKKELCFKDGNCKYVLNDCNYLLGQVLRQYEIDDKHKYISQRALDWWNEVVPSKNIWEYEYKNKVKCEKAIKGVPIYVGNNKSPEKKPRNYKVGEEFEFRSIFHDDHIIDISTIKKKLIELEVLDYENVKKVLDKIEIARILKEEDKAIEKKSGRGYDSQEIRKEYYEPKGIVLLPKC